MFCNPISVIASYHHTAMKDFPSLYILGLFVPPSFRAKMSVAGRFEPHLNTFLIRWSRIGVVPSTTRIVVNK